MRLISIILVLLLSCTTVRKNEFFDTEDIKSSQKLVGLEFSNAEVDTMLNYLSRNRQGIDSLRKYPVPYDVAPALWFDPLPDNFQLPESGPDRIFFESTNVKTPGSDTEIAFLPIHSLAKLLRDGSLTSEKLTQIYLDRLKTFGDTLEAVITITEDLAMRQARKADRELAEGIDRGYLHGIPYGLKDLIAVPDYPTTWGAYPYKDQIIDEKGTVVKKLEEAGAVLVAKLTSGALARGDVWYGGKTKNPWNLEQGASGSSAGPGSAVGAGLVAFAIGTETWGSILSPSIRCGITGLRPTYGAVSRHGVMALSWTMDKVGPMARDALDCALILSAIKGEDDHDRTLHDFALSFEEPADLSGYRIGYFEELFENDSSDVSSNQESTLDKLRELGAELEPVEMITDHPFSVFDIILRAEAGSFFDTLVLKHHDRTLVQQQGSSRANSLRQSRFIPAVEYLQANRHRKILIEAFHELIKDYDFLVAPVRSGQLSLTTNLTGHPAIAVPDGFDEDGHPTAFVLVGNLFGEGKLLEAAYLFQKSTDFDEAHPPMFSNTQE